MAVQRFNFARDHVYFSTKVATLMKGTSDDESPIPGYLYKEITDLSYESPVHCEFLLEFLVKRLNKNSCPVKLKTLKLMKHLVEEGEPSFRRGLHKKSGGIQEATKFSGPPHPLHGNMPYLAVRQTAKELSAVLSELNMVTVELPRSQESQKQIPQQKMESLGNTIRDGIEKLADQLIDTPAQRQAALLAELEKDNSGDYVPPVLPQPQPRAETKRPVPVKKVVQKSYAPGRAGGGWDTVLDTAQSQSSGSQSDKNSELSDRLQAQLVIDWSAEEKLVTEYLFLDDTSQFILLRPSQLKVFKKKCQDLNREKVVEFINIRMQSTDDYVVVRAMLLLETFLLFNTINHLDFIVTTCQNQLNHLVRTSSDQRIIDKAEKIIAILEKYSSYPNILVSSDQPS